MLCPVLTSTQEETLAASQRELREEGMGVLWAIPAAPQTHTTPPQKDIQGRESSTETAGCPEEAVPWLALSPSTELMDGLGPGHGITVGIVHLDPVVANTHGICGHHSWAQREHTHTAGCLVSCTSKLFFFVVVFFFLVLAAFLRTSSLWKAGSWSFCPMGWVLLAGNITVATPPI